MNMAEKRLEVIERKADKPICPVPILFIHGAWHGAWCWDYFFLPYFQAKGYNCYALSLRGHGNSPGERVLRWSSINDYVDDVKAVADQLGTEPILVGHSMGGYITQKYLETYSARGAVLLASVPPKGAFKIALRIARIQPKAFFKSFFTLNFRHMVVTPEQVSQLFFSPDLDKEKLEEYHSKLCGESFRAILDMLLSNPTKTKKIKARIYSLGAANDRIVLPTDVKRTADAYGGEYDVLDGIAHDMMLEPNWQQAADKIIHWIKQLD